MQAESETRKPPLGAFLRRNPFPGPFTDGLFFRDKMRAIHKVAPEAVNGPILDIGGGQSGLTKMLYPDAAVTVLDADPAFAEAPANRQPGVRFVPGDATALPFGDDGFALVTLFDLVEHVDDDASVAREALRVVRPGGLVLVTTPQRERWRYPYHAALAPISRDEDELMAEWGHVRRGYTEAELDDLFGRPAARRSSFVNSLLAVSHDVAFSRLGRPGRLALHAVAAPFSFAGYLLGERAGAGTEIAAAYSKEAGA